MKSALAETVAALLAVRDEMNEQRRKDPLRRQSARERYTLAHVGRRRMGDPLL